LKVGYFAQAHEDLNPDLTVLDEILRTGSGLKISEARNFLGSYLFSGEDDEKPVAVLSGGERGRLALAKLALLGANLLLLDEPTTHLDLRSQEILQEALAEFPGTILLVSHDRYLIEALATQVWAISSQGREMTVHEGGYASYAASRREAAAPPSATSKQQADRPRPRKSTRGKIALADAEARIDSLEKELARVSLQLEEAGADVDTVRRLGEEYALLETQLQDSLKAWEELAEDTDRP
jgi:ATP-binding cassette subfamily F protein 3